jgi:hypothetical protein
MVVAYSRMGMSEKSALVVRTEVLPMLRGGTELSGKGKGRWLSLRAVSPAARSASTGKEWQVAGTNWQLRGEYMESCNCDYLCPCIYTNPQAEVTHDHCTAALIFRIDEGHSGSIDLDGLCFALVIRSGKVMANGNWIFAGVVDARADDAQRQALSGIVSGQAGGPPGMIRANLVSDFRGVEFKPIDFRIEGLKRAVSIPDILSFEIEGVVSRNGGGESSDVLQMSRAPGCLSSYAAAAVKLFLHMHTAKVGYLLNPAGGQIPRIGQRE